MQNEKMTAQHIVVGVCYIVFFIFMMICCGMLFCGCTMRQLKFWESEAQLVEQYIVVDDEVLHDD